MNNSSCGYRSSLPLWERDRVRGLSAASTVDPLKHGQAVSRGQGIEHADFIGRPMRTLGHLGRITLIWRRESKQTDEKADHNVAPAKIRSFHSAPPVVLSILPNALKDLLDNNATGGKVLPLVEAGFEDPLFTRRDATKEVNPHRRINQDPQSAPSSFPGGPPPKRSCLLGQECLWLSRGG